jgi:hypothetical protein
LTAIDTWIDKQLQIPVNKTFRSSCPQFSVSLDRFNLKNRAQKLFEKICSKYDEFEYELESQPSLDAIFLFILVCQAGNDLAESLSLPWDRSNDPAYYTLLKEFLIDPTRAGPHFFNDEKFAGLTEKILQFIIKK